MLVAPEGLKFDVAETPNNVKLSLLLGKITVVIIWLKIKQKTKKKQKNTKQNKIL